MRLIPYKINLQVGAYLDRFEIVFHNKSLSIKDDKITTLDVHYLNSQRSIIINNPEYYNIQSLGITNLLGQEIYTAKDLGSDSYITIKPKQFSTGIYIINVNTDKGSATKKVIIE
jgi:hypothetical protein